MHTILLVEDEADLVATLTWKLRREGFHVISAQTGRDGLSAAWADPRPDLVLLDLMLPDIPGTEVCRQLRADSRTADIPVVMLTARAEEIDRVVGFEVGADDYMTKPFSPRELVLRVRAVLRRSERSAKQGGGPHDFGSLRLDEGAHRVWLEGEEVPLTMIEFKLLAHFLTHKNQVQSRDQLLRDVWGYREGITSRTVDTHVKRLRRKLGPETGKCLETLRGVGYRFSIA
ncbi:MAG TPA: response regulator transcription factor [Myxococcota bacterium]|nr:response regulator transcription factor [Myxococcota bacterium]